MSQMSIAVQPDPTDEIARLQAALSTLALDHALEVAGLQAALDSRTIIGEAIGLLMYEYKLTEEAALRVLRRRSSHANVKLRVIAAEMLDDANRAGGILQPVADC